MKSRDTNLLGRLCAAIVDKRTIVFLLFILVCGFCAVSRGWVQVNDSLTDYLDESTETRLGLDLMDREFTTYGTADVLLENVTIGQAEKLAGMVGEIAGVKEVEFEQDADYFRGAAALLRVTFTGNNEDATAISALKSLTELLAPYDAYIDSEVGNPQKIIVDREMLIVDGIAFAVIVLVLLLTSKTYGEVPVLLLTFGAAVLLNMGTNYLMGEISFVTNSIAIVLQLALAIDYAIILCHRYLEEHENLPAREAAIAALSKAIPEISASSLTTISGLLALSFMKYKLGLDLGMVLIKAILLSLFSVFVLMPGLLVLFSKWIDKSHHKSFLPKIPFLGKIAYATRFVIPVLFVAVFAFALRFSGNVNFVYYADSVESIRKNDQQIAQANITKIFGEENNMAIVIPTGDYAKETRLIAELKELNGTVSVTALSDTEADDGYMLTDKLNPRQFAELTDLDIEVARTLYLSYANDNDSVAMAATNIDAYSIPLLDIFDYLLDRKDEMNLSLSQETQDRLDDLKEQLDDGEDQLLSDDWTRIVVKVDLPIEGTESYEYLNILHGILARYYGEYYVVGDTTSCNDLRASFENDNVMISVLTIVFVIVVLLLTFKSAGLPVLLILIIQGSIWCNFSVPYVRGMNLYFLTYLIISAIQMGANIDYAIVISSRYMELKRTLPLKEAMVEALNLAFPTVVTSGTILASAGFAIGFVASHPTICSIGVYLAQGTLISIFLVLCVLPQFLLLGDSIIKKTSFDINLTPKAVERVGAMRIDGRVRGTLNGVIDAEVHGVFRGTLNAAVEMGALQEEPVQKDDDTDNEH